MANSSVAFVTGWWPVLCNRSSSQQTRIGPHMKLRKLCDLMERLGLILETESRVVKEKRELRVPPSLSLTHLLFNSRSMELACKWEY